MRDRTLAIIITVAAVILFGCPGLTFLCLGITDFVDYYALQSYIFGVTNNNFANLWGSLGVCAGFLFIAVTAIIIFLVLRRKNDKPLAPPSEPIPPISPDQPLPPAI